MAVTTGHGNPDWTRDEVILALDLYFECEGVQPGPRDKRVIALSELLRAFPYHSKSSRKESFRNADGVAFKLQNLRQVATGRGLTNVARIDREVWAELGADPASVHYLASLIRTGIQVSHQAREEEPEYEVFAEGRVVTEAHLRRERHPKLRLKLMDKRRAVGRLSCELCSREPEGLDTQLAEAIFEVHHIIPLAAGDARATRMADLALLCANCHRQVHRAIASQGRWLTLDEVASILKSAA